VDVVPAEAIERAIEAEFTGDKAKFVASSIAAFRAGYNAGTPSEEGECDGQGPSFIRQTIGVTSAEPVGPNVRVQL